MNKILSTFYENYRNTPRNIKFVDIYILITLVNILLLFIYGYFWCSFDEKISVAAIFTALGNLTFSVALREQISNKSLFNIKREKIIFDFVLCSLVLYIGVFSYMHLN
ncbi:conserved Plasmodium protein, unknown function [Plasmodium sp. gorilla clade G2]|uniref:conserved Plasmodium protein, unknown function n=1 Tax=Plasmodium sp. gorilla clade G2 TaxID=880535 RepID=UPI000D203E1F|nr:conserved Plasmodium protein, unknown function [Plasmodium sp. gorilla clade G2]SOV13217.1 conserved Plasmodium protein, unknown function [Plasmodium sp. gorilla clade G2]